MTEGFTPDRKWTVMKTKALPAEKPCGWAVVSVVVDTVADPITRLSACRPCTPTTASTHLYATRFEA